MSRERPTSDILNRISEEVAKADARWPAYASAHEGYAVLAEEVEELWEHVRGKQGARNLDAMRKEAIQVAAVAVRFARDLCDETRGRR